MAGKQHLETRLSRAMPMAAWAGAWKICCGNCRGKWAAVVVRALRGARRAAHLQEAMAVVA